MRIGIIYLGRFGAGGPFSLRLAKELAQLAKVEVCISAHSEILADWQKSALSTHVFPTFQGVAGLAVSLFTRRGVAQVAKELQTCGVDVLIFTMAHPWNALLQSMLAPIPSVVIVHDPTPHPGFLDRIIHYFENRSVRRASALVGLSQSLQRQLSTRAPKGIPVSVIPHGQLYEKASPDRLEIDAQANRILFFGRITPYKGLEVLLSAFQKVQAEVPSAKLQIVGSGNLRPYQPLLRQLTNLEVINQWVDHQDIDTFFKKASLLALPYTSASQSGVVAAAATYGLPVIATDTGGLSEQIVSGVTGILVPPGSVDALVIAIKDLLLNPHKASQLGQALKERYPKDHSWAAAAEGLLNICNSLIKA